MNAAINYSSNQAPSNTVDSLCPVAFDVPAVQALSTLPEDTDKLRTYLDFVIHTVQCLAAEMYVLIDAVTKDAKYSSHIRGMAEYACVVHAASAPKTN